MTCSAVIIENRFSVDKVMDAHAKFLPPDWDLVHISQPIHSIREYNELLVSREFWEAMTDVVLIFQWDSGLLRKGIEAFLEWDFCGASIAHMPGYMNGGLSLRRRDAMLAVIDAVPYERQNEDCYFVDGLRQIGGKLPSEEVADKFSVETKFLLGSVGFHAINVWLSYDECEQIRNQYA